MKTFWRIFWLLAIAGGSVALARALRRQYEEDVYQLPESTRSIDTNASRPIPARTIPPPVPIPASQPVPAPAPVEVPTPKPATADIPEPAPVDVAPDIAETAPALLGADVLIEPDVIADKELPDEPPPPPSAPPIVLSKRSAEGDVGTEQARQLWLALQQETYRQRSKGFRPDWAFAQYASRHNLGAPLAPATRITLGSKEFSFQPFARATIFNEIPKWLEVQNLNAMLNGSIPERGIYLDLLEAAFGASGALLESSWAFHQTAVRKQLGPPLMDTRRIEVGEDVYSVQVFAGDTLYSIVPQWAKVERLSETEPGALADALWAETYKPCGAPYQPDSPAHQFAVQEKLGTPLSGLYEIDFEGSMFQVQVFALDTIFASPDGAFSRSSTLDRPDRFKTNTDVPPSATLPGDTRDDALGSKRPTFGMLPVAGQPRILQFYGYTRWAKGDGSKYYRACQGRHPGIDFAVPVGTPLLSVGHGVVVYAGLSNQAPFGGAPPQIAIVRYGSVYVLYGHSSAVRVARGQRVRPGQVVSLAGDYGGPHLHFEVRPVPTSMLDNSDLDQPAVNPGYTINPLEYFSNEMQAYFEHQYNLLDGDRHFCRGSLRTQEHIIFGGPLDTRPCTD